MKYDSLQWFSDVVYVLIKRTIDEVVFCLYVITVGFVMKLDIQHTCIEYVSLQWFCDVIYVLQWRSTDGDVFHI